MVTFNCLRCARPTTVADINKSDGICDQCDSFDPSCGAIAQDRAARAQAEPVRNAAQAVVDRWYNGRPLNVRDEGEIVEDLIGKLQDALTAAPTQSAPKAEVDFRAIVAAFQKHERHLSNAETRYWCSQWRFLAEQMAAREALK